MSRQTHQREAIRQVLEEAPGPLSPQEIAQRVSRLAPGLGVATVYRAVKLGQEEGWLKAVDLGVGPKRYEPLARGHHHHFSCDCCQRVFDLQGCPGHLEKLLPRGFEMKSHDIVLHGWCDTCARKR